jgi:O-antigen ligase
LEWLVWLVLAEGVLVTSALFFQLRFVFRWIQLSALGSMFMNWFVALAFGQALINRRLRPILRLALIAAVLLTLYVAYVVLGNWKSGWVPPLVAIGVILFIKYPRRMIFFAPPAILLGWYLAGQVLAAEQYSWTTRLDAWTIVADIAKANPILGLGFGNYYWYVSLIPIRGFFVPFNSHNQYADLFAQMGLLGLVCFLWIFWELGRLGWRLRERVPEGFPRAYVYGVLGGLGGTLVAGALGDWVLPFVYNVGMKGFRASVVAWLFLGGLVALEQMYTRSVFEPKE